MNEEKVTPTAEETSSAEERTEKELTREELLIKENEEMKADLMAQNDKYLRLMAEYDNFRKRSQKERLEIYPEATAKAVEKFLPLADNFERAMAVETADEKYKAGIMMIYNQLGEIFKSLGVEVIDRVGEEFDPNLENAVMQVEDETLGDNTVAAVLQKGYKLGDKVIRPAMVSVANC